jgi:acetyl esterase/lipase
MVFAGNSSGATLIFSLAKFLLAWNQRADPSVLFHGRRVALPLPAGIATVSGWCDQTDALPSWVDGGQHDILSKLQPALWPEYPIDSVWPSRPPREHPYTRAVNLDHELVTPAAVYDWKGAPPMWLAVGGEERGLDGNKAVASRAARSSVPVTWVQYEGMPHEWMILLRKLSQAKHCFDSWGEAILRFVGEQTSSQQSATHDHAAVLLKMPDCQLEPMTAVEQLASLDFEEMRRRMKKKNAARPIWTGSGARDVKARI